MIKQTLVIGADHAGFALKQAIQEYFIPHEYEFIDVGTTTTKSCDYPIIANALCHVVKEKNIRGILVCGTGIGMSMAANRIAGIRAGVCANAFQCEMACRHNNCNVLCLGERVTGVGAALGIVKIFLHTAFEEGRHLRRVNIFDQI